MVIDKPTEERTPVQIGPRLRGELERRVRELQARHTPTPHDLRELAQLRGAGIWKAAYLSNGSPLRGRMGKAGEKQKRTSKMKDKRQYERFVENRS